MDTFNEVVTIFVGQAGTQVSSACWELFCLEHGIKPNGYLYPRYRPPDNSYLAFFAPSQMGKFTPRTVIVDLEPTVINEMRTGAYGRLFDPDSLITGKEDAANNFARGYYTIGRKAIDVTMDRIRTTCENCSNLSGFIIFRSIGGGTGSGFTTLLLEHLDKTYKKKPKLDFAIYPAPDISPVIVEPYNSVLSIHGSMDYKTCCFIIDNQALYNICARKLNVQSPMYRNLNRLQAQVVSSVTTSMRFGGSRNSNLQKMCTNLIPCPRIHFLLIAYAPFITCKQMNDPSVKEITFDCFSPQNQMMMCDPNKGVYLSCCLLYRGKVQSHEIHEAVNSLKNKKLVPFAKWSPTPFKFNRIKGKGAPGTLKIEKIIKSIFDFQGARSTLSLYPIELKFYTDYFFHKMEANWGVARKKMPKKFSPRIGINYQPPIMVPGGDLAMSKLSVASLSNSTAIKQLWINLARKFDLMYQKRAFLHHYLAEGMEEDFFKDARASIGTIYDEYVAIET